MKDSTALSIGRAFLGAATLASGVLQLLWVLLLHIPRALAGPDHANETAGVFEALAISGVALLVAGSRTTSKAR